MIDPIYITFYNFNEFFEKGMINAFAKSIDPCQPAQSAQAGMGRNFSLSLDFTLVKGPF